MNPADNPKEVERTEPRRDGEEAETDADTDTEPDMNETPDMANMEPETTMLDEIDTVMAGSNPLENLDVSQVGPAAYRVLSARNGGVTVHNVDLANVTCTCEDMQYNNDGNAVCAHIAKCMIAHPARMKPEESAMKSLMDCQRQFAKLREQTAEMAEVVERERTKQLSRSADDEDTPDSNDGKGKREKYDSKPQGTSSQDPAVDPHEAADELKAAFDEVVEGMEVEAYKGNVWYKTGYETPDELPFPGKPDTWETFIGDPEIPTYDPDGDSPGQYFKNYLKPEQVDDYIQEVLK